MKHLNKTIFALLTALLLIIPSVVLSSGAYENDDIDGWTFDSKIYKNFRVVENNANFKDNGDSRDIVFWGKNVIKKDLRLTGRTIYIKRDSSLIIKKGACFTLTGGNIIIENGAKLYVTDGKLICDEKTVLTNYGDIIVRKNSSLTVKYCYKSNGWSSINIQGEMYLGNSGKYSVRAIADEIRKYDDRFSLDNYCLNFSLPRAEPTFNYCIGTVVTDYFYTYSDYTLSASPTHRITKPLYDQDSVYDESTAARINESVVKYLSDNNIYKDFVLDLNCFDVDNRFEYSYENNELIYYRHYYRSTHNKSGDPLHEYKISPVSIELAPEWIGSSMTVLKNKLCKCISKQNVVHTVNAVETGQR